jgi:single-strand DNA-binding protein
MASLNKVTLIGNLTRDPEIRSTQDGRKIANVSLATNEVWKDKATGERKDRAEYHRVVIFNDRLADLAESHLRKGSQIYVEGQLQTRKWTDQQGVEKYTTEVVLQKFRGEIVMLGGRQGDGGETYAPPAGANTPAGGKPDLDDEIPW